MYSLLRPPACCGSIAGSCPILPESPPKHPAHLLNKCQHKRKRGQPNGYRGGSKDLLRKRAAQSGHVLAKHHLDDLQMLGAGGLVGTRLQRSKQT